MAAAAAGSGEPDARSSGQLLRLCEFNVLAPSARICAPLDRVPWRQRHEGICDFLEAQEFDIICLQEFDFARETQGFRELYEGRLGRKFSFHCKQRTRGKPEGLAMLVNKDNMEEICIENLDLEPDFANRVAQVARLRHRASGQEVVVAHTHLTVAHASNKHDIPFCRPLQMKQVLQKLLDLGNSAAAVFVCADMNSDHLETGMSGPYTAKEVSRPVSMALEEGLSSALHQMHPGARPITHTSSYAQDGCVDYIFFRPSPEVELVSSELYPPTVPIDQPWSRENGWGDAVTLSDHRPLLAEFLLRRPCGARSETPQPPPGGR